MRMPSFLALGLVLATAVGCDAGDANPRTAGGGSVDMAKSLHRGELAAVASYADAIQKNDTPAWTATFDRIHREHQSAADDLRARVVALNGTPDASAGAWGGWSELVAKGAAALGDGAARDALRLGEQHGVSEYEEALKSAKVDEPTKALIRATLLPRAQEHVRALEALKK